MFALVMLLAAVTAPAAPTPMPTNPFTLDPLPRSTTLPTIGATRSRPVCTAIRQGVKPALEAAMKNDAIFHDARKTIHTYVATDTDDARNLRIVQMDKQIQDLVKSTDALDDATKSTAFTPPANARAADAKAIRDVQASLAGVSSAQHVQLDAFSGFVETERARLFGRLDESQQQAQGALAPTVRTGSTPSPVTGFLADSAHTLVPTRSTPQGLLGARLLDRDLSDISAATARRVAEAAQAIDRAVARCKGAEAVPAVKRGL